MKHSINILAKRFLLSGFVLIINFGLFNPLIAAPVTAPVDLATSPLATATTTTVKPNLLFVLDDSGSMAWDHMPDDSSDGGSSVTFKFGYYGLRSSQCNQVYYDPNYTYLPPVDGAGVSYPDSNFTDAWVNGFRTSDGKVNLNTSFKASQSLSGDSTGQSAYYFAYIGEQDTLKEKNYHSITNAFYKECNSSKDEAPGDTVFTKRRLATTVNTTIVVSGSNSTSVSSIKVNGVELMSGDSTASSNSGTVATNIAVKITKNGFSATANNSTITISGPATAAHFTPVITRKSGTMTFTTEAFSDNTAAKLTNFANWYSYYRNRMLMMKTSAGRSFSSLNNKYRVGLLLIGDSTPVVGMNTFEGAHRTTWYSALYGVSPSGSTPLRKALSTAGKYYAGAVGTDPVQYSCQQNFSILSTDGYWNTGDGVRLDDSDVGNQDGTAGRPMYDGAQAATTVTTQYTQNDYTRTQDGCGSGWALKTQPQKFSCSVTAGVETCTSVINDGAAYTSGTCKSKKSSVSLPSPNPSGRVATGTPVTTPGSTGGSSDSLSDVAMYYYNTDLRPGGCDLCTDNVFISGLDNNTKQHMTTFTLGLGASGWMNYSSAYLSGGSDDYNSVNLGSTASSSVCTWQASGTVCNWPLPGMTSGGDGYIANIDDLWHAAVNGRGAYFSATNPESLSVGLSNALAAINARKGAASAAATSTLNPVANNNYAYVASYSTVSWKGNLEAREINVETGEVSVNAAWCVENVAASACAAPSTVVAETTSGDTTIYNCVTPNSTICSEGTLVGTDCKVPVAVSCAGSMSSLVDAASDTRKIWTKGSGATTLNNFKLDAGSALTAVDFDTNKLKGLTQWSTLDSTQKAVAVGNGIVNYLRGQKGNEDSTNNPESNRLFRAREAVFGDAVESQPAFIGPPTFSYLDTGYDSFKSSNAGRSGTIYIGANDGMMHAFDAASGVERWAYVPSMVIPNMWKLADSNYAANHQYYVNGSPVVSDINVGGVWKTILVAGLNGGGRGYYALDITDPVAPELLWEFTPANDGDLGYTFGNPVITKKADGTWVVLVTSGYNNIPEATKTPLISSGNGKGYLYVLDAGLGSVISKIGTGIGSTSVPSGLAQISSYADAPEKNNTTIFTYGGDLLGNVWRFDINAGSVVKFAELKDPSGISQPIMTKPELGNVLTSDGKVHRVVFVGTGKYLETNDLTDKQVHSLYAIKDDDTTASPDTATLINPRTFSASPNRMVQQTISGGTTTRTVTSVTDTNKTDFKVDRGWFVDFPDSGERQNIGMQLVLGTLIVPTTIPSNTVCAPGGTSWLNYFNYQTGGAVDSTNIVSTSMAAPIVGVNVMYIPDPSTGKLKPKVSTVTAADPTPQLIQNMPFSSTGSGFQKKRAIWRELIQ